MIELADISTYLQKILSAIYGEEVRGSIHDALSAMNTESSSAMEYAKTAQDSAAASAETAETHATTATAKAATASVSAQNAKTSENNAKVSETNTTTKAAEAKASEIAAANSEAVATQKASEAADSQAAAALSEAEAKAAEERVKTIKMEAETLRDQVEADKIAADASRDAAEAARDAAALSEANAHTYANTALTAEAGAKVAQDDAEAASRIALASKNAAEAAKIAAEAAMEVTGWSEDAADKSAADAAASALSAQQYSGKPPQPKDGTWWIWDADQQKYIDSGIGCDLPGPIGIGIADIKLTSGDHTPGTTDIYTVSMTDGASYNISIYNGRNGTGAGDVLGISFDLVIPVSGWLDGEITIADARLVASKQYKYFLSVYDASLEEFLECNVQPRDITKTGFITFKNEADPEKDITVNLVRLELSANGTA